MSSASSVSKMPAEATAAEPTKLIIDIMIVAFVSSSVFYLEDVAIAQGWIPFAEQVRGAIAVVAGAFAAVGIVFYRGGSFADLGFKRPERWAIVPFQVVAILFAFIVAQALAPTFVSLFMELPEPDLSRYDVIAGNLGAAIVMLMILPLTASIPEEIIYRGFLIGRLSPIFGQSIRGDAITVLIQALIFGSIHFQWGIGGMFVTFIMGAVWGSAYLLCGRNLWIVILAHSTAHILLVLQLYFGESIIL